MTIDDLTTPRDANATARFGAARVRKVPGESGIWLFLMGDMLVFAAMFFIYSLQRAGDRSLFVASQRAVNPLYGLLYTLLLLASSWAVVMAVTAARRGLIDLSARLVMWGFAGGAVFVGIKFVEYGTKLAAGITPVTNQFFTLYFVLTFVHLMHAAVGLGVLMYVRSQIHALGSGAFDAVDRGDRFRAIEVGTVYWHMVDLLWVVLFALFYLRG